MRKDGWRGRWVVTYDDVLRTKPRFKAEFIRSNINAAVFGANCKCWMKNRSVMHIVLLGYVGSGTVYQCCKEGGCHLPICQNLCRSTLCSHLGSKTFQNRNCLVPFAGKGGTNPRLPGRARSDAASASPKRRALPQASCLS